MTDCDFELKAKLLLSLFTMGIIENINTKNPSNGYPASEAKRASYEVLKDMMELIKKSE